MTKILRRATLAALIAAGGALGLAPQSAEAGNRDFTLANSLPWTTVSAYVRPAGGAGWSEDLLGASVLPSGDNWFFRLGNGQQCMFDVQLLVNQNGAMQRPVFQNLDLCALLTMTVYYDGNFRAQLRNVM